MNKTVLKLRPHANELPYATLFIENRNRLTENHTNTKKRLTRINKSHALQRQVTEKMYSKIYIDTSDNRENSSNSPTVPARGTTLSTQQNDNDNDTTSRQKRQ